jgi:hypothetical protein
MKKNIPAELLEIGGYTDIGYKPVVDYGAWRVAVLNYIDELDPENLGNMQRHDETDEVFVLLAGHFVLFLGEGRDTVGAIHAVKLEPMKMYNVKRGVWHTHTLEPGASVLIVENVDTSDANSPKVDLDTKQRAEVVRLAADLLRK